MSVLVYMGSIIRKSAVGSHMLVQSGHDGCECCWIWYRLINVWMAKLESVVSLAIVCQFLYTVAVNSLPMSEKGVIMGRMLVTVCGVR